MRNLLGLIFLGTLAACDTSKSPSLPTPTPLASPTATPTPIATPTPVGTPVATPPGKPPTPTPTPSPTPVPLPIPTPSFTALTPLHESADTQKIYVSNDGNDANSGKTPETAVKTINRGGALVRGGFPDWLLLRRGDQFKNQSFMTDLVGLSWKKSGRSAVEPLVISAYSDPAKPSNERPEIDSADKTAFHTFGANHLYVIGLYLHSNTRDPYSPDYAYPDGVKVNPTGFTLGYNTTDILVEDCEINSYTSNLILDAMGDKLYAMSNIRIRYNFIENAFSNNRSQGLYAGNIIGLLLEGNVFNHNGWTEKTAITKTSNFMPQNHNTYLRGDNTGVVVRHNIFINGANYGLEDRPGGIVEENLFIRNGNGLTFGLTNGAALTPGGVTGEVMGNIVLDGRGDGQAGSSCIEMGNIKPGGTRVHDNLCARCVNDPKLYGYALMVETGSGVSNTKDGVGVNDLTVENNLIYNWSRALYITGDFVPATTGFKGLNHLTLRQNEFQNIPSVITQVDPATDLTNEVFLNNTYDGTLADKNNAFKLHGVYGWTNWQTKLESTALWKKLPFASPEKASVESYEASLHHDATLDAFIDDMKKNPFSLPAVLTYLRKQF